MLIKGLKHIPFSRNKKALFILEVSLIEAFCRSKTSFYAKKLDRYIKRVRKQQDLIRNIKN